MYALLCCIHSMCVSLYLLNVCESMLIDMCVCVLTLSCAGRKRATKKQRHQEKYSREAKHTAPCLSGALLKQCGSIRPSRSRKLHHPLDDFSPGLGILPECFQTCAAQTTRDVALATRQQLSRLSARRDVWRRHQSSGNCTRTVA